MMTNFAYLQIHMGVGNLVACAGLVRALASRHGKIRLFVRHDTLSTAATLFEWDAVELIPVEDCHEAYALGMAAKERGRKFIGTGRFFPPFNEKAFWSEYYRQAGVDYAERFDRWREPHAEAGLTFPESWAICKEAFASVPRCAAPYSLVIEHRDKGVVNTLSPKFPVVCPNDSFKTIFAWQMVLYCAEEVIVPARSAWHFWAEHRSTLALNNKLSVYEHEHSS